MKKIAFAALFALITAPALAVEFYNPTISIDGVAHKIITSGYLEYNSYREAPESAIGFCRKKGFRTYTGAYSMRETIGPYALLNEEGKLVKTFSNSTENRGRFWIADSLDCHEKFLN